MKLEKKEHPFKRNLFWSLFLLIICYVGLHLLARTEGVRSYIAEQVSDAVGQPATIEQCALTPALALQMRGLVFEGVTAQEVRVGLDPLALVTRERPRMKSLQVKGLQVIFSPSADPGGWAPAVLNDIGSRLGAVLGAGSLSVALTAMPAPPSSHWINTRTTVALYETEMIWQDSTAKEIARLTGLEAHVQSARFHTRTATQFGIECAEIRLASGAKLETVQFEAVAFSGYAPVVILAFSDRAGEYEGFQSKLIWQDLTLHLEALGRM